MDAIRIDQGPEAATPVYPRRRRGIPGRAIDGEMVLLDRHRNLVHQLNSTATFIWDRCDGARTVLDIARDVAHAFDVTPERAAADVMTTILQLEAVGLVEAWAGSAPDRDSDGGKHGT
ncbi:MAG TPA: PqqD family protein [Candidatus Binatia bacterium]|nr:PqqD family protein [Candidatus Binatia bacterium]